MHSFSTAKPKYYILFISPPVKGKLEYFAVTVSSYVVETQSSSKQMFWWYSWHHVGNT